MEGVLQVHKLSENAYIPVRQTPGSAGFDLFSAYDYCLPPYGSMVISTDLQIIMPLGTYGQIASRSGLAARNFITAVGGVIDSDYTGNVAVILMNYSGLNYYVAKGQRVAQLICQK